MRAAFAALLLIPSVAFPATLWTLGPSPSGETVTFTDQTGPCVAGAKVAIYQKGGKTVPACYRIEGGMLFLAFLDGDSAQIPAALLQRATGV